MRSTLLALSAGFFLAISATSGAMAQSDIEVKDAWARATPGGAQAAAAYVTLQSAAGDTLTGVATPIAQKAELHSMTMDGDVMKMRQVDSIDLPAGQPVALKPGGYHIMLTGLTKPLQDGQSFPLTLTFAKAGIREVTVTVQKVGAMAPGGQTGGMNMPMHH